MKVLFLFAILAACAASAFATSHDTQNVAPDTALRWLKNGNKRYLNQTWRKDGKLPADREKLAAGQHPHTIVLSCSDSRVPPEHIFDQGLGEIFVIRVAGEALDSSVIASIEYAVEHLGTRNIVVMGHTSCGAVKVSIGWKPGESAGSDSLDKLVADIKPRISSSRMPASMDKDLAHASTQNAVGVARDLAKRSHILGEKLNAGQIRITPALYHIDTGVVDFR